MTTVIEQELEPVGKYLQQLAKSAKKTMRQIATDTKLSVNSVKAAFSGKAGNVKTYDTVATYLGSTFIEAVLAAYPKGYVKCTPTATAPVEPVATPPLDD